MTLVLPDVELLVVHHLGEVTGFLVCTTLPDGTELSDHLPVVRIMRVGGPRSMPTWNGRFVAEDARISIDVFAATRQEANQATGVVRTAWEALKGVSRDGGSISRSWEEIGPTARPEEPNTGVTRIGWIAGLTVRPV